MAAQLDQNATSVEQEVRAHYWHMIAAISKLILIKDCTKFNKTLMDNELCHLPPQGGIHKQHCVLKYDPAIEKTRIYEKGYLMDNNVVASDILLVAKRAAERAHTASKEVAAEKKVKVMAEKGKVNAQKQSEVPAQGGPSSLKIRVKRPRQKEVTCNDAEEPP
ncbi:hypothetical protein PAXRUDRAFT_28961 [Paxillus rubicundulus Ve08.2h10]|uniref:Uncharacterized protein n=1 Tax=Paxillus rubicundulus Ve08.2h10 TaxID=930991 RepID=A0A0D0CMI7_9AGAM|nr:hypothetical protein PAXRUDRAFT_28961 [Paxillus rubicundulus Ve08.2h10]